MGLSLRAGVGPHVQPAGRRPAGADHHPELSYLQARFAGLVSYGLSADLLSEILPLGRALHATTVRRQMQATAQRLEDELGDEQSGFITGCPARTCRWSSAWTAATSTPRHNGPGVTAGSK